MRYKQVIYIVIVHSIKNNATAVSQIGYKTLEGAMRFIHSRSDYKGQPFTDWSVTTEEHIYEIKDIQITE